MLKKIEKLLITIFDQLPKKMSSRVIYIFWLSFPLIFIKILKGIFRINKGQSINLKNNNSSEPTHKFSKIPSNSKDLDICIRFSGGTDSTLIASTLAPQFKRVHLLTFNTSFNIFTFGLISSKPSNTIFNLDLLKNKFGKEKFIHEIINFAELRDDVYFNDFQASATKKDFIRVNICPACTLSMHIETIIYCLKNKIKYVSDGANIETGKYPWQTQTLANLLEFRDFYKLFKITYIINPNYYHKDSDNELSELGVINQTNIRKQYSYRKKTQQFCIPIHLQSICRRLHSKYDFNKNNEAIISKYFKNNIQKYELYIKNRVNTD